MSANPKVSPTNNLALLALARNASAESSEDAPILRVINAEDVGHSPDELVADFGHTTDAANFLLADIECPPEFRTFVDALIGLAGGRTNWFTANDEAIAARWGKSTKSVQRYRNDFTEWQKATSMTLIEIDDNYTDKEGIRHAHRYKVHVARIAVETMLDARASSRWSENPGRALQQAAKIKRDSIPDIMPRRKRGRKREPDAESTINRNLRTAATLIEQAAKLIESVKFQKSLYDSETSFEPNQQLIDSLRQSIDHLSGQQDDSSGAGLSSNSIKKVDTGGQSLAGGAGGQNVRKETIHSRDALQAVEAFTSVGVGVFKVLLKDDLMKIACDVGDFDGLSLRPRLAGYLEVAQRECRSLIMDVKMNGRRIIQVDEASAEVLELLKPVSFLQVETSEGNGQSWLALPEDASDKECEQTIARLFATLKPLGANRGASGGLRWPGSINYKPERNQFRIKVKHIMSGCIVSPEELTAAGLLALLPVDPQPTRQMPRSTSKQSPPVFPNYDKCLAAKGGDRSRADASFLKICSLRQISLEEAAAELGRVSERVREDEARGRKDYLSRTMHFVEGG